MRTKISTSSSIGKWIIIVTNILVLLVGAVVIFGGYKMQTRLGPAIRDMTQDAKQNLGNSSTSLPQKTWEWAKQSIGINSIQRSVSVMAIVAYALGASIWLFALMGVCGAWLQVRCLLIFYSVGTFLLSLVLISIGVAMVAGASRFQSHAEDVVTDQVILKYQWVKPVMEKEKNKLSLIVDWAQNYGECCGVRSNHFWDQHRPDGVGDQLYPLSCCSDYVFANHTLDTRLYCDSRTAGTKLMRRGCVSILIREIAVPLKRIGGPIAGVGCFFALLTWLACCITCGITKSRKQEPSVLYFSNGGRINTGFH